MAIIMARYTSRTEEIAILYNEEREVCRFFCYNARFADVAQLVEQLIRNQ